MRFPPAFALAAADARVSAVLTPCQTELPFGDELPHFIADAPAPEDFGA